MISETEKVCGTCDGVGYTESIGNDVVLCPECQGKRKTTLEIRTNCADCSGRGFHPKIMQRFVASINCSTCWGRGVVTVVIGDDEDDDYVNCSTCEGSGKSQNRKNCALPAWKSSPYHPKVTRQFLRSVNGEHFTFQTVQGTFIEINDCPDCKVKNDPVCLTCLGIGRVVVLTEPCSDCGGSGEEVETELVECPDCNGTGEVRHTEDREV